MDPAVDALATLITEELMAVLPGIITRIRNSEEFAKIFPLLSTEQKESEKGEASKKRKRCRPDKLRDLVFYTEAIPLCQVAVASESEDRKHYAGKFPLDASCAPRSEQVLGASNRRVLGPRQEYSGNTQEVLGLGTIPWSEYSESPISMSRPKVAALAQQCSPQDPLDY
ncbi:hypothetical protein E3N88_00173 [Mikania micrantha]|uniref:Uncharacterized protein n=1 Tax=Mikania micrantha TaxID=192012 RepID=A0A5N6PYR4_9ASTR|nr:hypothetical protein E3N88_00173 [Mikania micrantha]